MSKAQMTVVVEQEIYDVVKLLCDVAVALKAKQSLAAVAVGELAQLEKALAALPALAGDVADSKAASLKAALLPISDLVDALLTPAPVAAPAAAPAAAPSAAPAAPAS